MKDYAAQIQRIKKKLQEAKEFDELFRVFGAGNHRYEINSPVTILEIRAFEKNYGVQLPDCYKSFLLNIGNGGRSYLGSGAGPFFGIYPFGQYMDDLIQGTVELYLKNNCVLHPNISQTEWDQKLEPLYEDNISDEDFEELNGKLYGGIQPIGSQGCSFIHALVLNGPYRGMIINLDRGELSPPKFCEDNHFLDWYERWLNEIISGKLITTSPSWFGYPHS